MPAAIALGRMPLAPLPLGTIAFIGACLTGCVGSTTAPAITEMPPIVAPDIRAFSEGWQSYIDETGKVARQADCQPRLLPASPDIQRRGAVVMLHGFSGCPQQFFELGERIANRGFDVLLPVLPGHGLLPTQDNEDDLSRLPGEPYSEIGYAKLAERMNGIMATSPGTRVIVGFSLGGAIGLNANLQAPHLYDRQLLLSPMLAIWGGAFVEGLAELIGRIPGIRNIRVKPASFREECRDWQVAGRAGFCDYRYRHVLPLLVLEDQNRELNRQIILKKPIQVVGAGDERYISNDQLVSLAERQSRNGPISLCFMPDDVAHEMLSPYENSGKEMYWLADLLDDAVAFIADGKFFPSLSHPDQDSDASPRCRINSASAVEIKGQPIVRRPNLPA